MSDKPYDYRGLSLEKGDRVAWKAEDGRMFIGIVTAINPIGSNGWNIQTTYMHELQT